MDFNWFKVDHNWFMPDMKIEDVATIFGEPDVCLANSGLITVDDKAVFELNSKRVHHDGKTASIFLRKRGVIVIEMSLKKINVFYNFHYDGFEFLSFHLKASSKNEYEEIYSFKHYSESKPGFGQIDLEETFLDKPMKVLPFGLVTPKRCVLLAKELFNGRLL